MKALMLCAFITLVGCKHKVPLYCEQTSDCDSGWICDVNGEFAGSDYTSNTCIPSPFDAGMGADAGPSCMTAGAFLRCEDQIAISCDSMGHEHGEACDLGCNPAAAGCNDCEPSTTKCVGDAVVECDSDGLVAMTTDCAAGCNSVGPECFDVDPSNGLGQYLDLAWAPTPADSGCNH